MKKILVVDNEHFILELVKDIIEDENWDLEIDTSLDGAEAMTYASKIQYDFIVLDFLMPVLTGGEFCQKLREGDYPSKMTPILFMTTNPEFACEYQDLYENISIMSKPLNVGKFLEILRENLQ